MTVNKTALQEEYGMHKLKENQAMKWKLRTIKKQLKIIDLISDQ